MSTLSAKLAGAAALLTAAALAAASGAPARPATLTAAPSAITISPNFPADLDATAGLPQAAVFAWQEFIALNWPAKQQTGGLGQRDSANTSVPFGSPTTGPLVWHTFRAKVEIFPAPDSQPNGYVNNAAQSYGYDALPKYVYSTRIIPADSADSANAGNANYQVPWINLDENDEIGQDAMYAGNAQGQAFPGPLILFMAKANRNEYNYVAANNFYNPSAAAPAQAASKAYVATNDASPPQGGSQLASLPNGTVEIKAAWRRLTAAEASSGRFYQTRVRFYREDSTSAGVDTLYHDDVFGLVALHIIHKTPSQPHFVFATFEQADNILTASGDTVETVDGAVRPKYQNLVPMEVAVSSQNASQPVGGYTRSNIQQLSPDTSVVTPGDRVYILNSPRSKGFATTQGFIAINRRLHSIPAAVIAANQAAHAAIIQYDAAHNQASPWRYYKLVNVQYKPIDKPQAGMNYMGADSATYYLSNSVVETNYNLQVFSGQFQPTFLVDSMRQGAGDTTVAVSPAGLITDWCAHNTYYSPNGCPFVVDTPSPGVVDTVAKDTAFDNVKYGGHAYNMGGCMGCHGNAQASGSDFSFILGEINNPTVQTADPVKAPNDTEKFFRIFRQVRGTSDVQRSRGSPARGAPRSSRGGAGH
jgi:hypothetical protein